MVFGMCLRKCFTNRKVKAVPRSGHSAHVHSCNQQDSLSLCTVKFALYVLVLLWWVAPLLNETEDGCTQGLYKQEAERQSEGQEYFVLSE